MTSIIVIAILTHASASALPNCTFPECRILFRLQQRLANGRDACTLDSVFQAKKEIPACTITGMRQVPTIEQIISKLMYHVAVGKAHLAVARGLANSDPVVLKAATVFFGMSIDSHLYSSQMYAARLHDRTRGTVTVSTLLKRAGEGAATAKYGSAHDVRAAIASSKKTLSELAGPLKALTIHRNERLAHTDPRTITDPVKVAAVAGPHFPELEKIFIRTGNIVNEFSRLYRDTTGILEILYQTDYETVVEFVSAAKCEQVRRYEAEFGAPAPFPRPKGCQ